MKDKAHNLDFTNQLLSNKLIQHGPVKGTMMMGPHITSIWRNMQKAFSKVVLENSPFNVKEVIFPTLIPTEFIQLEKNHIEGFSPELWLTRRKNKKEEIALRPTSEVLFNSYISNMDISYNELPIALNQWATVFRIEENVKPFLRTSEFLWQEGHTYHASALEAKQTTKAIWKLYEKFMSETLLLPVYAGEKTPQERFAGAKKTFGIEVVMPDGQALQVATSHYLGTNFTSVFNATYRSEANKDVLLEGTSWGFSTRALGAILLMHSDDIGFRLPSSIAPSQAVFLLIKDQMDSKSLLGILSKIDIRTSIMVTTRKKLSNAKWELLRIGTPIVIIMGEKDRNASEVNLIVRSDYQSKTTTAPNPLNDVKGFEMGIRSSLTRNDKTIQEEAKKASYSLESSAKTSKDVVSLLKNGKSVVTWISKLTLKEEKDLKVKYGVAIRVILETKPSNASICPLTNKKATQKVLIARAY